MMERAFENSAMQWNISQARGSLYDAIANTQVGQSVAGFENFLFKDLPQFFVGGSLFNAGWRAIGAGKYLGQAFNYLRRGESTFAEYKALKGGTQTLDYILTTNKAGQQVYQRISTEFSHTFISQAMQRAYNLPNWMVNNSVNVWKVNTIQHSLIDSYRFQFLRAGIKSEVGWFGKYNWFTKFPK
ncbi:hypothetical protein SAMN05216273_11495 [Chryseobacterium taihuense]|uniref:Uncharacterized protein n=2 Tax=Chryseobacterium taihuense TaxID=1141221 RepID=A0ABY0QZ76_9FLAO|nr:hypothetical protein SAMN05216273_11495 [Chryseobacterium taihuense]